MLPLEDLDDAYHEYLWGEDSPRAFARKARYGRAKGNVSRNVLEVQVGLWLDLSRIVSR